MTFAEPKNATKIKVDDITSRTDGAPDMTQGVIVGNNKFISADHASSGTVDIVKVNASNDVEFSEEGAEGIQTILWGGTSGGSANAHTVSLTPTATAYFTGMTVKFLAGYENTGATTLNVDGIGTKSIKLQGGLDLPSGALRLGVCYEVVYDGTDFLLLNPLSNVIFNETGTTVSSTASETNISSFTIPADLIGPGGGFEIEMFGEYLNNTASTYHIFLTAYYGSSYFARYTKDMTTDSDPRAVTFRATMVNVTTSSQVGSGSCHVSLAQSTSDDGIMNDNSEIRNTVQQSMSIDSTSSQTLKITAEPEISSASLSFTPHRVIVRRI